MKNPLFLILVTLTFSTVSIAQNKNDVIHLAEGPKEVQVIEVGFNTIKYSFPNETAIYSISKHHVNKIEFASGREELFDSPFQPVSGLDDFEKVYISYNPDDVYGLESKGELYSKATGVTTLSSINNVKNRALDKLKAEAAMLGANVVLIGDVFQRGNTYGGENQAGNSTQTTYSGTAYSTEKIDNESVIKSLSGKSFHHYQTHRLNRNAWSPERTIATTYDDNRKPLLFEIENITEKDGEVYVSSSSIPTKSKNLKVISADEEMVILMERNDKIITNYILVSQDHNYFKNASRRVVL